MTSRKPDVPLPNEIVELLVDSIQPAELGAGRRERMRNRVLQQARDTTPDGTKTIRHSPANWVEVAPFIEVRELSRDAITGTHVSLVRMNPGGAIEPHRHSKNEDFIVLEGECHVGTHLLTAGDAHHAAAGSFHERTTTRTGVLVLVRGELPYPSRAERT